jgi:putative zinc finger/helix-turn-helix YgiT family protein
MSTAMPTDHKPELASQLVCLQCEHASFEPAEANVIQELRGESFTVLTPVMRCARCGWQTLGPGQIDALRVRTADAYRRAHDLLTSEDIRARRERLRMSQRQFADYLGVGAASIPRWEGAQIQEPVYDQKIREKTDRCLGALNAVSTTWITVSYAPNLFATRFPDNWSALVPPGAIDIFAPASPFLEGFEAIEREFRASLRIQHWRISTGQPWCETGRGRKPAEPEDRRRSAPVSYDATVCLTA